MTERLYYADSYCREFTAEVVEAAGDGRRAYLDRTAFYPTSGGQLCDTGTLNGVAVIDVVDEGDRIAHLTAAPLARGTAAGSIDWTRRFDHMQQHSGQHLLSAVFTELFGANTVSVHLGAESSTLDLDCGSLTPEQVLGAEHRANEMVCENRAIRVEFANSSAELGLRKASAREGVLRVVSIDRLDRSACGGTHVRATGEIGAILLRKLEKIRGSVRVEFLCGLRAVRRARADFDALTRTAQVFSAQLDAVPDLVRGQTEAARDAEKARKKLESDLAGYRARELYSVAVPGADGVRRHVAFGEMDALRSQAQGFCSQPKAVFIGVVETPPAILLAASDDSGCDAGQVLKAALAVHGGRGGGTARMAQGSVSDAARLPEIVRALGR